MLERCCWPTKIRHIRNYRDKGIKVCIEWLYDFEAFYKDMGECPPRLTLGRIDSSKGYSKDNCRWETWGQQRKTSSTPIRYVVLNGETLPATVAARKLGVHPQTILSRMRCGWTPDEAISTPVRKDLRFKNGKMTAEYRRIRDLKKAKQ